jgi:hypothetical protein
LGNLTRTRQWLAAIDLRSAIHIDLLDLHEIARLRWACASQPRSFNGLFISPVSRFFELSPSFSLTNPESKITPLFS